MRMGMSFAGRGN
jgi:hypothetical protein